MSSRWSSRCGAEASQGPAPYEVKVPVPVRVEAPVQENRGYREPNLQVVRATARALPRPERLAARAFGVRPPSRREATPRPQIGLAVGAVDAVLWGRRRGGLRVVLPPSLGPAGEHEGTENV